MSELEHFFTKVGEALWLHHATMIMEFQTPIHEIGETNLYLIDIDFVTVNKVTYELKFHNNEQEAVDFCLDKMIKQ